MNSFTNKNEAWVSPQAIVEDGVSLGLGTQVWEFTKIRSGAKVGANVSIGQAVYIGPGVVIGDNCKIQNGAQIYEPAIIGEGVFIGPGAILTNDRHPSAVNMDGSKKRSDDWTRAAVTVGDFASVGAGAICLAPLNIASEAQVGAGAVVTRDVEGRALVLGIPARPVNSRSEFAKGDE